MENVIKILTLLVLGAGQVLTTEDVQLSKNITPSFYNLTLDIDFEKPYFEGTVIIDIDVTGNTTNAITLNGADLNIKHADVYSRNHRTISLTHVSIDPVLPKITLILRDKLVTGEYTINITYHGELAQDGNGLHFVNYTDPLEYPT